MASISTCFTITPKSRFLFPPKPSINLKPPDFFPRVQTTGFPRISGKNLKFRAVRASIDVGAGVRPGSVVESDKLPSDVRKRTMDAVDAYGGRVTIGDVASKAGLKLNEAQKALQAVAADTDGFLEVSDEGDVLYVLPKDYRAKLAAKSFRLKVEPWVEKAKAGADYLIRASFGTALVASIVIVFTAIVVVLSSKSDDNDNRGRRSRANPGFTFFLDTSDLFWYTRRRRLRTFDDDDDDDDKMNFIESVFSFVFGDGDPNEGFEEKRWKLIGQYIASNGGVVTAEELAPYLDVQSTEDDESYVLPVLLRFDGQPELDEEGNILYRFPLLQRTASSQRNGQKEYVGRRWTNLSVGFERLLKEKKWQFSKTNASQRAMVIGLGGLNLFGVVVLGTLLQDLSVTPNTYIQFVANLFPLLQIYAGSFFVIPLFRWFFYLKRNAKIEERNKAREKYAQTIETPDISLRRKLLSARDMAQKMVIGQDRIIYDTSKDMIEQDYEAREWNKRFWEIEKTD